MSFLKQERGDKGTERAIIVRTRQIAIAVGSYISTLGIYWFNHTKEYSGEQYASFVAAAVGLVCVVCPIISEIQDRGDEHSVAQEAEDILRRLEEQSAAS
jgi:hypothetical protein